MDCGLDLTRWASGLSLHSLGLCLCLSVPTLVLNLHQNYAVRSSPEAGRFLDVTELKATALFLPPTLSLPLAGARAQLPASGKLCQGLVSGSWVYAAIAFPFLLPPTLLPSCGTEVVAAWVQLLALDLAQVQGKLPQLLKHCGSPWPVVGPELCFSACGLERLLTAGLNYEIMNYWSLALHLVNGAVEQYARCRILSVAFYI